MREYETIFIMKEEITEEEKNKVVKTIKDYISINGNILKAEELGKKKLAYEIKGNSYGYYYLIEFEGLENSIRELERIYRITESIIKFIVIRKD